MRRQGCDCAVGQFHRGAEQLEHAAHDHLVGAVVVHHQYAGIDARHRRRRGRNHVACSDVTELSQQAQQSGAPERLCQLRPPVARIILATPIQRPRQHPVANIRAGSATQLSQLIRRQPGIDQRQREHPALLAGCADRGHGLLGAGAQRRRRFLGDQFGPQVGPSDPAQLDHQHGHALGDARCHQLCDVVIRCERQSQAEIQAVAVVRFELARHQRHQLPAQQQAEPFVAADRRQFARCMNADADLRRARAWLVVDRHLQCDLAVSSGCDGMPEQAREELSQPRAVADPARRESGRDQMAELETASVGLGTDLVHHVLDQLAQVERLRIEHDVAGFELTDVEHVVDARQQRLRRRPGDRRDRPGRARQLGTGKHLEAFDELVQRLAHFFAQGARQLVLELRCRRCPAA